MYLFLKINLSLNFVWQFYYSFMKMFMSTYFLKLQLNPKVVWLGSIIFCTVRLVFYNLYSQFPHLNIATFLWNKGDNAHTHHFSSFIAFLCFFPFLIIFFSFLQTLICEREQTNVPCWKMIDFANNCSHIAYASQTEYGMKIKYKLEAKKFNFKSWKLEFMSKYMWQKLALND